jgi:hypothetical protein
MPSGPPTEPAQARWDFGADIPAAHIAPGGGVDVMIDAGLLT